MAAYAALVSLMHIIDQIQNHPRPPITLDKEQVQSLTEKVVFLQDFLEVYNPHGGSKEVEQLQTRIANSAYAAEDIIESHIVDQIQAQSTSHDGENISSTADFYHDMEKVIKDMDFVKNEVMEIKDKPGVQDQLHINSMLHGSSRSPSSGQNIMVGFEDVLHEILDKLTGQQSSRQIIPIVGMGGVGKTTLARNAYEHPLTVDHFDVRAWVTISQEHNVREVLLEILLCQNNQGSRESLRQISEEQLGEKLYKSLSGRTYLIILDDMWSIEAWDKVKFYFPDYNNGSRIIVTTRMSQVAFLLTGSYGLRMNFLDEERSWNLLRKIVFGEESCPLELEEIGRNIAKNCKGLPLSIVVIGGVLARSNGALKYWEYVAQNLNSIVSSEDDERCLKILYTSYNFLPIHLKPCFLYMGIYGEDSLIHVSELTRLWVAEGFLKPIRGKSLEFVAEEYLKDLIDRNLIIVHKWGFESRKIYYCNIHDLLRDLCIKEAQKDKFCWVTVPNSLKSPEGISTQRRIAIHERTLMKEEDFVELHHATEFTSFGRSLICNYYQEVPSLKFRLLRVLKAENTAKGSYRELVDSQRLGDIFQLINSRHLAIITAGSQISTVSIPSSLCLLWNLQTLIVTGWRSNHFVAPIEIWKMALLRHVKFDNLYLPDPPCSHMDKRNDFFLGNLQTLSCTEKFNCSEEVVKRIPNIKELEIVYEDFGVGPYDSCLNNLGHLQKLEFLDCTLLVPYEDLVLNLTLPNSLKKLILFGTRLSWEDVNTKIGSLPLLQMLQLRSYSVRGPKWETVEGKFRSLRCLHISGDLECWTVESSHIPCLEELVLWNMRSLTEIPSCIGEIPTLQSIVLSFCSDSVIISAKRILEEQEELGNDDLQVRVQTDRDSPLLDSLACHNFHVIKLWEELNPPVFVSMTSLS